MNSYLNLEEAIEVTGLNEKTLQRFITAGYIQTRIEEQLVLLSISDLNKTFGLNLSEPTPNNSSELKIEVTSMELDDSEMEVPLVELQNATITSPVEEQTKNTSKNKLEDSILEKVIALQDRLIEDKESQISEQLGEIRWLRTRIEKLEDQAEKDKILLLSGNQTINRLIELNGNKRGWFGKTLTWLGNKE